ncbi:MAG: sigma-70 family RNA polymerase sigma factor [Cyanobacteria bacterium P01_F01_bin.150]
MDNRDIQNLIDKALAYKGVVTTYFQLVSKSELSDKDADDLERILLSAESDETLYLLINELDQISFESVGIYEEIGFKNSINNSEYLLRAINLEKIAQDYHLLANKETLSISDQERISQILDIAEKDSFISLLVNEIDELTFHQLGFLENQQAFDNKIQKRAASKIIGLSENIDDDAYIEINQVSHQNKSQDLEQLIILERIQSQQLEQKLLLEQEKAQQLEQKLLLEQEKAQKLEQKLLLEQEKAQQLFLTMDLADVVLNQEKIHFQEDKFVLEKSTQEQNYHEKSSQLVSTKTAELKLAQLLTHPIHHQRIERIARSLTKGINLTWEDAAQVAHFKVVQTAQSENFYYGGAQEFYHWATKVAHSAIIDLIRQEYRRTHISLNQPLSGTDLTLMDTVPDPSQNWDELEQVDLMNKVREAIADLDQIYPQRHYRQLWIYRVQGLTQTKIAQHLNITQGAVSKRWHELTLRVTQYLGLNEATAHSSADPLMELLTHNHQHRLRRQSSQSW